MAETILGLVVLSTTFMIAHLLSDFDRYLTVAQDIRAKYIFSDPTKEPTISKHDLIKDYQAFRTLIMHIGYIMLIIFGCFSVAILSLWSWGFSFYKEGKEYSLWALIVFFLMVLVIFFQITKYIVSRRILTIIFEVMNKPICGSNLIFRDYCKEMILENPAINRVEFESNMKLSFTSEVLVMIGKASDQISFIIITGQFIVMYGILAIVAEDLFNPFFFLLILAVVGILWVVHIIYFEAYRMPEAPV